MTDRPKSSSTEQLKGSVKEAIGKLTGDGRVEAEGRQEKREPKSSKDVGPRRD